MTRKMYSPTAKARLQTKPVETPAERTRRITLALTIAPTRRRLIRELDFLRTAVAMLALEAYYMSLQKPDRRPLWKRCIEAGKQLKGAK